MVIRGGAVGTQSPLYCSQGDMPYIHGWIGLLMGIEFLPGGMVVYRRAELGPGTHHQSARGWPRVRAHLQVHAETKLGETGEGVWTLLSGYFILQARGQTLVEGCTEVGVTPCCLDCHHAKFHGILAYSIGL